MSYVARSASCLLLHTHCLSVCLFPPHRAFSVCRRHFVKFVPTPDTDRRKEYLLQRTDVVVSLQPRDVVLRVLRVVRVVRVVCECVGWLLLHRRWREFRTVRWLAGSLAGCLPACLLPCGGKHRENEQHRTRNTPL